MPYWLSVRHKQILDKLGAAGHIRALDEDLARWVGWQMLLPRPTHGELEKAVIPPILTRWRCLLEADDAAPAVKNQVWVALATLLHKYGLSDDIITARALTAIDELNRDVVLSDSFYHQTPAIKTFLQSPPVPLNRRPRRPRPVTFLRPGDLLSIQLDGHFHAAFVHRVEGVNEYPIIEFYAGRFHQPPTLAQLSGRAAARDRGWARFGVEGLTYLPDPANQVVALASQHTQAPQGDEPRPGDPVYACDIIWLQTMARSLFDELHDVK
jgi:hypothetical protein